MGGWEEARTMGSGMHHTVGSFGTTDMVHHPMVREPTNQPMEESSNARGKRRDG